LPTRNAGSWCWPTPSSASIDSSELQKTQQKLRSESWTISEGRGDGGEGSKTLPVPSSPLPRHCESSILLHCPCCVWQERFAPHPQPLSPIRGEGSQMLFPQEIQRHWAAAPGYVPHRRCPPCRVQPALQGARSQAVQLRILRAMFPSQPPNRKTVMSRSGSSFWDELIAVARKRKLPRIGSLQILPKAP